MIDDVFLQKVKDAMVDERPIEKDEHEEHHFFLREIIPLMREDLEARRASREQWETIKKTALVVVVGSIVTGVIAILGYIGHLVLVDLFHVHLE